MLTISHLERPAWLRRFEIVSRRWMSKGNNKETVQFSVFIVVFVGLLVGGLFYFYPLPQ